MLVTQFDKFVNRSTQEILGSEIEQENLVPMLSTEIVRNGGVTGVKGNAEIYYRTGNVNLTPTDLGALDANNVYNGLDETAEGYALDARQGKVLNEAISDKFDKANVYNGLDKTAFGYALDARQGKALNDKINNTHSDIAIIIEGNQTTHTGGVAVGEYVIIRNSTISSIADGLYKAVQAIPANTVIDSTYLDAVDGGGLNELNSNVNSKVPIFNPSQRETIRSTPGTFTIQVDGWYRIDVTSGNSANALCSVNNLAVMAAESGGKKLSALLYLLAGTSVELSNSTGASYGVFRYY